MLRRIRAHGIGFLLLFLVASLAASAQYAVTDLGTLYNDPNNPNYPATSYAYGINNYSQIVGQTDVVPTPPSTTVLHHAFLYSGGAMNDLGTLYPDTAHPGKYLGSSVAYGINDYGQVVGSSSASSGSTHAFLWTPASPNGVTGNMIDLGTLYPNTTTGNSEAHSIDKDGNVVGGAALPISGSKKTTSVIHPFLWMPTSINGVSGNMQDLAPLTLPYGMAFTINPHVSGSTQITGQLTNGDNGAGHGGGYVSADYDPFLWTTTGGWGYIDSVHSAGSPEAAVGAFSINDAGLAVGHWSDINIDVADVWQGGSHTFLGCLQTSGISTSTAYSITNTSPFIIVGDSSTNSGATHAFIYQSGMVDLNAMIPQPSGFVLNSARGVNNNVQIVGFGTVSNQTHAFWLH